MSENPIAEGTSHVWENERKLVRLEWRRWLWDVVGGVGRVQIIKVILALLRSLEFVFFMSQGSPEKQNQ